MDQTATVTHRPNRFLAIGAFIVLVCVVGGLIGANSAPDAWYAGLTKAPWNPPNWVFAPVWLVLYIMIGIAGARTFLRNPRGAAMGLWLAQMVLNWAWAPIWFRLHLQWPAFAVIAAILLLVLGFITATWRADRTSALLFVPYAAWVAFASSLNLVIAILN